MTISNEAIFVSSFSPANRIPHYHGATTKRHGVPVMVSIQTHLLDPLLLVGILFLCAMGFENSFGNEYVVLSVITFLLSPTVFLLTRKPVNWRRAGNWYEIKDVLRAWVVIIFILLGLGFATKHSTDYSRKVLLTWAVFAPFILVCFRLLYRKLYSIATRSEQNTRTAVFVGHNTSSGRLAEEIEHENFGINIMGFFCDRHEERRGQVNQGDFLGRLADVAEFVRRKNVHVVYVALPMVGSERLTRMLDELRDTTASIYFVPDILQFDLIQARVDQVGGIPLLGVNETPFFGVNAIGKRFMDIVLSATFLLVLMPLMLVVAACVKYSSPGPVLFRQRRYGVNGEEFHIYKFRTMTVTEDGDVIQQAQVNDSRVTPIGRFLRLYSIDELPQFYNVLKGDMSIVGPRPHAVAHNEKYRRLIKGYMIRHMVKPGLTGWAQVNGYRGETKNIEKMERRVQHDLDYLRHWSIGLDLNIIFRTVRLVLKGENAH